MKDSIQFGDTEIIYAVRRSSERKDLSITVDGADVRVAAPDGLSASDIAQRVRRKAVWVMQKLDENKILARVYPRRLVSGESLHYLGRQYGLKVVRGGDKGVKLLGGELVLNQGRETLSEVERAKLLSAWYKCHLEMKIPAMLERFAGQLSIEKPIFQVRDLGGRWGSCGKNGVLYFHWQLARLPLTKVEFVCAHEMVHLLEPSHSKEFRSLLGKLLPEMESWSGELSL